MLILKGTLCVGCRIRYVSGNKWLLYGDSMR